MLKMIDDTIDEMNNSKEMKDKSELLLENEIKVIECIKRNVLIGAKEIISKTNIADRTTRRILAKLVECGQIEIVGNNKAPTKKYKIKE